MVRNLSRAALAGLLLAVASATAAEEWEIAHEKWREALGPPRAEESFGQYLARAAKLQHGVAYDREVAAPGPEPLRINLETFECVSFIESALALARCGWRGDDSPRCFAAEVETSRYRGGQRSDYASRLHYFVDWIDDNARRDRLEDLTGSLGGDPVRKDFHYISKRVLPRAKLDEAERELLARAVQSTEARLSETPHAVLDRERAPEVLSSLRDGDLLAFVRERPGLLVHHAGFVHWVEGTPRLLHASSYHERVVITVEDVTDYLLRRPERRGVLVARPLPPR